MRRSCLTIAPLLVAMVLSACNRANDALQPAPIAQATTQPITGTPAPSTVQPGTLANPIAGAPAPAAAGTTPAAPTPAQTAAVLGNTRLQIAPIVGASVEAATPLTQRLAARAKESGITLAGSAGQGATHVLKGYFSTISEGKNTTVIYVWDVYDPAGNRLHRINGQQKAPTVSGTEGWAAIPPVTMQAIADQTMAQLTNWLAGRPAG